MTNNRDRSTLAPCCTETLTGLYADWCRKTGASEAPALDAYAHMLVSAYAPLMRDLLSDIDVPFHVVNTRTGATGALLGKKCSCGRSRYCIILTSSVMLYLWRVLSTVASMVTAFEQLPGKIRIESRAVTDADVEQFRTALDLYFGREPPTDSEWPRLQADIDALVGRFLASPEKIRVITLEVLALSELFVILHELAHAVRALGHPGFVPVRADPPHPGDRLTPARARKWQEEVEADLDAVFLAAAGYGDKLFKDGRSPEDTRQIAVPHALAGAAATLDMLYILEARACAGRTDLDPFTSFEFRNHPPTAYRRAHLLSWGTNFSKESKVDIPWWIAECLHSLANNVLEDLGKKYPNLFRTDPAAGTPPAAPSQDGNHDNI